MSKVLVIYAVAALAGTFRRAGTAFTTEGTAFPQDHFTKQQLDAIHAEKRLSVREIDQADLPETVDTRLLAIAAASKTDEKGPAKQNKDDSPHAETLEQAFTLLDPSNKDHFTGGGVPQLDALSQLLGRTVKAPERDQAWKAFAAQQSANQQQGVQ
ncbi:HI1506-related protein [Rheinheimera aquimaris]|uniref:HI1506-related protein n=1 Tax=Rheinheimera aquimaris TaxID=412437 RepID=UPI001E324E48|nr:HI1506-related protein [Rheinheimera aquimaris]MCD1597866.1 hypothetical protein [Rheinheimera aquimaris]